jgi:pyridoxine 5-phosphate synthase
VHPRPDERHIRAGDVGELAAVVRRYPDREYNIEGNPFEGQYLAHIEAARPAQCTLVPDDVNSFTSDQGWKLAENAGRLKPVIEVLKSFGCRVSVFMDATSDEWELAKRLGADRVELYTEPYAAGFAAGDARAAQPFAAAARAAQAAGLGVNAGHDLNLENLGPFLKAVPGVLEVSIGHALIGDALEFGLAETVRRYRAVCGG